MDNYIIRKDGEKFEIKKNLTPWIVAEDQKAAEEIVTLLINRTERGPAVEIDDAIGDSDLTVLFNAETRIAYFGKS